MPNAVMLFAAGFGTRMGALTKDRPKPLVQVAGKPLIDHAMQYVDDMGFETTVVNAHYKADQIEAHFADTEVLVSVEMPDILDTGGGLKAAMPLLNSDHVFTMNTDAVWNGPNPLQIVHDAWRDDMSALLLCVPASKAMGHKGSGDFDIGQDGTATWGTEAIYTGVQILNTQLVAEVEDPVFSLRRIWENLVKANSLKAVLYPGLWCDVGHPEGIAAAEKMLNLDV